MGKAPLTDTSPPTTPTSGRLGRTPRFASNPPRNRATSASSTCGWFHTRRTLRKRLVFPKWRSVVLVTKWQICRNVTNRPQTTSPSSTGPSTILLLDRLESVHRQPMTEHTPRTWRSTRWPHLHICSMKPGYRTTVISPPSALSPPPHQHTVHTPSGPSRWSVLDGRLAHPRDTADSQMVRQSSAEVSLA